MIELREGRDGVSFRVRARPGSRTEGVTGVHDGAVKVSVQAAAEKGKANQAIVRCLATALGVDARQIELVRGATSGDKVFLLRGLSMDETRRRVEAMLDANRDPQRGK